MVATFVLVGGFWLGGWAWDRVAARLHAGGHYPRAVTLTGLGDRVHLASPDVRIGTHVDDVVNAIVRNDLRDVVLVGHSYGGVPITGAALRIPERLARLVYIDAAPRPAGVSLAALFDPGLREHILRLAQQEGDGWRFPLLDWAKLREDTTLEGISEDDLARWRRLATPQPLSTFTGSLGLALDGLAALPCTLISCEMPVADVQRMIAAGNPMFAAMAGPNWSFAELRTSHWPMFSRPHELADLLVSLV